jgi:gliding motility-associated-like protein
MRKASLTLLLCFALFHVASARHIAGGELSYTYNGMSNGNYQYTVTLKLYRNCDAEREFDDVEIISVFNKETHSRVGDYTVALNRRQTSSLTDPDPCITNPPTVCLEIAYYTLSLNLPATADGYILATQVNFRAEGMNNLTPGYSQVGATYTAEIPGTAVLSNGPTNNSALFVGSDLEVLCTGNRFSYSFAATDKDGDALQYSLCNAFSASGRGGEAAAATVPPYAPIPYGNDYSGPAPLGNSVQIDPATGLITGTAPQTGTYVIAVCVAEIRNGVVIATQRKDIQVRTSSCALAAASLLPKYTLCKESMHIQVSNLSTSTVINLYNWSLVNTQGAVIHTTTNPTLDYTFTDTGMYQIKLIVGTSNGCADSTTSTILVYPGFRTGFTAAGSCYQTPFQFTDTSNTPYGVVTSRFWDLGDPANTTDVSTLRDPAFQYSTTGNYTASLIVSTDKGCTDTITKVITVSDKPFLQLPFKDTLICSSDTLQLQAVGSGEFAWSPNPTISNTHIATPLVYPKSTTTYIVTLTEQGCVAQDSVTVNVVDFVTVQLPEDTTVCTGDRIQLLPMSTGLQYQWTPQTGLDNAFTKAPVAIATQTTTYSVTAGIGSCKAQASIKVTVLPYAEVTAGRDTAICYGSSVQLQAFTTATAFSWSPAANLSDGTALQPLATPSETTAYVLTATAVNGCPKPAHDTVLVTVLPRVVAFAGNDTAIVAGQPLQLQASGGTSYLWSPATGLSSTIIANPVVTVTSAVESITYKVVASVQGCADVDSIRINVFKGGADIYMPTAFTPNGDGRNDVIMPILVGMERLEFFRVYNRWGQLVFETSMAGKGWDGSLQGKSQGTAAFVFVIQGTDYTGKRILKKGTFTLIR